MANQTHVVAEGECLSSISFAAGFFVGTLWNLDENADLKTLRKDPTVLKAGDTVIIPGLRQKIESRQTGARHVFRRKGVPAQFKIRLMDGTTPRANLEYQLEIDGVTTAGRTGEDGSIVRNISPSAMLAELRVRDGDAVETMTLLLGCIDPITEPAGITARLRALGFFSRGNEDAAALATAVKAFQREHAFTVTGEVDDATRSKIESEFGA
jgi:hypothetical protein